MCVLAPDARTLAGRKRCSCRSTNLGRSHDDRRTNPRCSGCDRGWACDTVLGSFHSERLAGRGPIHEGSGDAGRTQPPRCRDKRAGGSWVTPTPQRARRMRSCGRHGAVYVISAPLADAIVRRPRSTGAGRLWVTPTPQRARRMRSCGRRGAACVISARLADPTARLPRSTREGRSQAPPPWRPRKPRVPVDSWGMKDLGALGPAGVGSSSGYAINAGGEVVGRSTPGIGPPISGAFRWTASDGMRGLPGLGRLTVATAINATGDITGYVGIGVDACPIHAMRWTASGDAQDLGLLSPNSFCNAESKGLAINARGQITGFSTVLDTTHAFLWTASDGMKDLGTLGGTASFGTDINDRGQVTGNASTADGATHAFLRNPFGRLRDLGTLGGPNSFGTAVNERGQVTGYSDTVAGASHAFLSTRKTLSGHWR